MASRASTATGPVLVLITFGGVFALLGLLMVFTVVHAAGAEDPTLLARSWLPLAGALGVLLVGAALFGTALRLHVLTPSLGRPRVRFQPAAAMPGTVIRVEAGIEPETDLTVEAVFAELRRGEETRSRALLGSGRRMEAGARASLVGLVTVPEDARPGEDWTLIIQISVAAGGDWREEHPLEIVLG